VNVKVWTAGALTHSPSRCLSTQHQNRLGVESDRSTAARPLGLWVIVSDEEVSESAYESATKWSDHTVGIAILFDYFHGIELMLKGFMALDGSVPRHHRLRELLADFEASHPGTEVSVLISTYTTDLDRGSPLGIFFTANGLDVDSWNEALRYPESKKGESFDHLSLQYGGLDTVDFWRALGSAAREIRVASVRLARSLEHT